LESTGIGPPALFAAGRFFLHAGARSLSRVGP